MHATRIFFISTRMHIFNSLNNNYNMNKMIFHKKKLSEKLIKSAILTSMTCLREVSLFSSTRICAIRITSKIMSIEFHPRKIGPVGECYLINIRDELTLSPPKSVSDSRKFAGASAYDKAFPFCEQ